MANMNNILLTKHTTKKNNFGRKTNSKITHPTAALLNSKFSHNIN